MNGQLRRLKPIAKRRARDSSGAEGVGKQLCCVQCSDSGTTNSPTRQGSAQNDKIVHKMSGMKIFCLLICNHNRLEGKVNGLDYGNSKSN